MGRRLVGGLRVACVLLEGILGLFGVLFWVWFRFFLHHAVDLKTRRAPLPSPGQGGDSGIPEEGTGNRRCQRNPEQG